MLEILNAYTEAFNRCYPNYNVTFERAKKSQDGRQQFYVILNGDKCSIPLSLDDIKEATAEFCR